MREYAKFICICQKKVVTLHANFKNVNYGT